LDDRLGDVVDILATQPAEAIDVDAILAQRRDDREVVLLAEPVVLATSAGGDVDDPGSLRRADVLPGDNPMLDTLLGWELIERPLVAPAQHLFAGELADDLVLATDRVRRGFLSDVVDRIT